MRSRAAPPHPGIYRVSHPPPSPLEDVYIFNDNLSLGVIKHSLTNEMRGPNCSVYMKFFVHFVAPKKRQQGL